MKWIRSVLQPLKIFVILNDMVWMLDKVDNIITYICYEYVLIIYIYIYIYVGVCLSILLLPTKHLINLSYSLLFNIFYGNSSSLYFHFLKMGP